MDFQPLCVGSGFFILVLAGLLGRFHRTVDWMSGWITVTLLKH